MNVAYLSRYFKEHTGIGLLNYINGVRIDYAKQLMGQQNITVAEAAKAAGFENQNTFIRLFKNLKEGRRGFFWKGLERIWRENVRNFYRIGPKK